MEGKETRNARRAGVKATQLELVSERLTLFFPNQTASRRTHIMTFLSWTLGDAVTAILCNENTGPM